MSILRTYNVQNPDSASVNVELSADGGVRVAGLSTFSGELRVGTGVTISGGVITATTFTGNLTGNVNATGLSTFSGGVQVGATTSITVGSSFIKDNAVGVGSTTTTGRNAGVGTAIGTIVFNATNNSLDVYLGPSGWSAISLQFSATGGTITTPGDGYRYHTFSYPSPASTFSVSSGTKQIEIVAIGAGGGGGGSDGGPPQPSDSAANGAGGAGGGAAYARLNVSGGQTFIVSVGGGGQGGEDQNSPSSGRGVGGDNGGGNGGQAGSTPNSGGGGGGGGWSGFYQTGLYYVVGGGGAGGGGSNEGDANNTIPRGGGDPGNVYLTNSTTGCAGLDYPGDGGGWGGAGGGVSSQPGAGGGGSGGTTGSPNQTASTGGQTNYGGSSFISPAASSPNFYAGGSGGYQSTSPRLSAGQGSPGFLPANPSWSPVIPTSIGDGGDGQPHNDAPRAQSGQPGIVVIRYTI